MCFACLSLSEQKDVSVMPHVLLFLSSPFAGRKMSLCDPADGPVLVHRSSALGRDGSAAHRPLSLPGDPPI